MRAMPAGWREAHLGELVQKDRPITYGVVQPGDYDPEGIMLVRGGDYADGWRPIGELFRVSPAVEKAFAIVLVVVGTAADAHDAEFVRHPLVDE